MSWNINFLKIKCLLFGMVILFGCGESQIESKNIEVSSASEQRLDSSPRVGIVDMQRLSESLGISRQMAEKRQKLQQNWERVDNATRASITAALKEFGNDQANFSAAQRKMLQDLELDRRRKLSKVDQENTAALQETNRWLMRVLSEKTEGAINAVGREMGFDLILRKSPGEVPYARPGVDVTDKILKRAGGAVSATAQPLSKSPDLDSSDKN